jgi:hypothetical protein
VAKAGGEAIPPLQTQFSPKFNPFVKKQNPNGLAGKFLKALQSMPVSVETRAT